jgi:hypothetical protein
LLQGPEEKLGFWGLTLGLATDIAILGIRKIVGEKMKIWGGDYAS